jgi:hypothetical protein
MNELQKHLIRTMMLHSPYSMSRYKGNGIFEPIYCAYCDAEPEQPHKDDCLTIRIERILDATPDGEKPDFSKLFDPPIYIVGVEVPQEEEQADE